MEVKVKGGMVKFSKLTSSLYKRDKRKYFLLQAEVWVEMLNDRLVPTKWYLPSKQGTSVEFKYVNSIECFSGAIETLEAHIVTLKDKFNICIELRI